MEYGTQDHPECREGEVWLTNTDSHDTDSHKHIYDSISTSYIYRDYKTERIGSKAYDIYGNVMTNSVPVFISKKEWDENEKRIRKEVER